jgi:hypothetical protein
LTTFSQITVLLEGAARSASKASKETQSQKLKVLNDLAKTQAMLCTKLRLTTQARTHAVTLGRQHSNHKPSFYQTMLPEEWQ